jgi:hypothetical protein
VVLLFVQIDAHAFRIPKGTISLGGASDLSVGRKDTDNSDTMDRFRISVESGYFFMDNLEIGAHAGLSYADSDRSDCTSYTLAPFLTYHLPVNDKSNFYLTGRVGFAKSECDYDRYSSDGDGTLWSVGAGWEYFLIAMWPVTLGWSIRTLTTMWNTTVMLTMENRPIYLQPPMASISD